MNTLKVLCVENDVWQLDALKYLLEAVGFEVVSATTGDQALSILENYPVLGVLLESDLPDATGLAVRAEMKRIKPEIPVLLFNGVGSQTPFLLKFFDSYIRDEETNEWTLNDMDS